MESNPTDVALTINSAASSSAATSSPAGRAVNGARATTAPILPAVRLNTTTSAAPAWSRAATRLGRPSGTDHGDVHPTEVDAIGVEGGDEALPVGAVADQAPVLLGDDGVDGPQRCRGRRQPVDGVRNMFLVRGRDRQTGDAERAHRRQGFAGTTGRNVEGDVSPVDPRRIEGRLMDHRRQ